MLRIYYDTGSAPIIFVEWILKQQSSYSIPLHNQPQLQLYLNLFSLVLLSSDPVLSTYLQLMEKLSQLKW